ncbi:unnamed protein product [Moneuplotes crassus]|uniref:MSP domain-containing protein n=1 Tax=Euplotes crassus TaxID=5936 RepID=A0AAD2CZJ9_EUPCR|nr:unnamed protein product [Moneuplotes crassus]
MHKIRGEESKYDNTSEGNTSNSDDSNIKFLFRSALDVGSTFLKIEPDDEDIDFYQTREGTMVGRIYLENSTPAAPVAFFGWSSHLLELKITPNYGFIMPGEYQYIEFEVPTDDPEEVDKALYFIKALPLAKNIDMEELEENIDEVFHEHNQRILFTLATMSGTPNLEAMADEVEYDNHIDRENIIHTQQYKEKIEMEKRLEQNEVLASKPNKPQEQLIKPEADASVPEIDESETHPRESDLLGLNEQTSSKELDFFDKSKDKSHTQTQDIQEHLKDEEESGEDYGADDYEDSSSVDDTKGMK